MHLILEIIVHNCVSRKASVIELQASNRLLLCDSFFFSFFFFTTSEPRFSYHSASAPHIHHIPISLYTLCIALLVSGCERKGKKLNMTVFSEIFVLYVCFLQLWLLIIFYQQSFYLFSPPKNNSSAKVESFTERKIKNSYKLNENCVPSQQKIKSNQNTNNPQKKQRKTRKFKFRFFFLFAK